MQPRSAESRGAGRSERSSTVATAPTQVTGRVQSNCSSAIPGTRIFSISGAPRLPAGLSRSAPSARGPGEEPAHGPG
ncbi:hypothetical protein NDU88_004295 [Pleurodeles waltl]|uniref:Uncharacterized protein n=1 Tax=Pleurodeles waltl TaxID=8319 RepID=A0AAV7MUH5_PLEWA|nr:hypothetical protein NDU88_004295 [Pleurodeles waltl]